MLWEEQLPSQMHIEKNVLEGFLLNAKTHTPFYSPSIHSSSYQP